MYNSLFRLGTTFVTTNYDKWLDERFPETQPPSTPPAAAPSTSAVGSMNVVYRPEEFRPSLLNQPRTVIHLHGSVLDQENMVLTTSDYLRHYQSYKRSLDDPETENPVLTFLDFLFRQKTVLFLGYGLDELEILEYILEKRRGVPREANHFILQGFFSHQKMLIQTYTAYFLNECGVELIPFRRDERDWDQLVEVVSAFGNQIPATSVSVLQKMQDMEDLLDG